MSTSDPLPRRVEWRVRVFTRYFRRWMGKNFHAIRLSRLGKPPEIGNRPMLVVLNHPSWWDPLMGMVLADLFAGHHHYVPIDARALQQYRIFEPLGFYGVEHTTEGAMAFLRTTTNILSRPKHAVWLTAQGQFTDPRQRPISLRPGGGHLIRRLKDVVVVPLAIEYPFWQERYPEALAHFGSPIGIEDARQQSAEAWTTRLELALTETLDALAREAMTQDPQRFEALVGGKVGIGGVYDWWRWLKGKLTGKGFAASHEESVKLSEKVPTGGAP